MKLEPITFDDYPKLLSFFKKQPFRLCEYSLPSLIAWKTEEYMPVGVVLGGSLITGMEFDQEQENRHLMLPISVNGVYAPEALWDLANDLGFERYWYVPEEYLNQYGQERLESCFSISRQKGYDDYIYLSKDLISLQGNRYAKKRNLIHQFKREYLDRGRVMVEELTPAVSTECIDFLDRWCEERGCDYETDFGLACEREAAVNLIEHIDAVNAESLMVRVDGAVSAFGIGCGLTGDMGVLHFEKAFSSVKGLYQYVDKLCAERFFAGYRYINKESDMDESGLAKAKKSYHPVFMVRSYSLTLR